MEFVEVNNNENYRGCLDPRNEITFVTASVCIVRAYNLLIMMLNDGQINGVCKGEH